VNLLSGSISGPSLASTLPISIPNFFSGFTNFYFPSSVGLTPGTTYYFQPVASAGDPVTDISSGFTYLNGSLFISGVQQTTAELWFREGIVVPEPATAAITMLGIVALVVRKRRCCD
jgi:hypothetical protein